MKRETAASAEEKLDATLEQELADIRHLYKEVSCELPGAHLDSRILREARTEIAERKKQKPFRRTFWQKLELPVFGAGMLAATVWALQVFLPDTGYGGMDEDLVQEQEQTARQVTFEVQNEPVTQTRLAAHEHEPMPELDLQSADIRVERAGAPPKPTALSVLNQKSVPQGSAEPLAQTDTTATEVSAVEPLSDRQKSAEDWSKEILELVKRGQQDKARKELSAFKKAWPDYPIDEQLSGLRGLR